ncbi:hypothetical protein GCM10009716_45420 [Streptomyces sodiiphilus]|uniref:DUF4232 domain-containing protein n=1 Tax=Streptomyces sodiiphilus TaxID=226217 RepID=A0ABN2PXT5_9ACTN
MTDPETGRLRQGTEQPERADAPAPEVRSRPDADQARAPAGQEAGPAGAWPGGRDEEALRRLLRDAVGDLEPSRDALVRLERAVPTRRRRRRQLVLGTAASFALFAVGTPVVQYAATERGMTDESGSAVIGGRPGGEEGGTGGADGGTGEPGAHASGGEAGRQDPDASGTGPAGTPSPDATAEAGEITPEDRDALAVSSPRCDRDQLGDVRAEAGPADEQGRIHGTIRLANVSGDPCRIKGTDELTVTPLGDTDAADFHVVTRAEGDRATRLPTPDQYQDNLVLLPGESYQVLFAWVPSEGGPGGCPVHSPVPAPPDDGDTSGPGGSEGSGGQGGAGGGSTPGGPGDPVDDLDGIGQASLFRTTGNGNGGATAQGAGNAGSSGGNAANSGGAGGSAGTGGTTGPGGPEAPSGNAAMLRYTPAAGEPRAAQLVLEGVCAGTVYRTGVLAAAPTGG